MVWKLLILFVLFLGCSSGLDSVVYREPSSEKSCKEITEDLSSIDSSIRISTKEFGHHYSKLNKTLSGNLATVFRSEWKAKENSVGAARLLDDLVGYFSPMLRGRLSANPIHGKAYVDEVVNAIALRKQFGEIRMRDKRPPIGVRDRTFTYYTRALIDKNEGKHQVRLRRYVRTIDLNSISKGEPIRGYFQGKAWEILKNSDEKFTLKSGSSFEKGSEELAGEVQSELLTDDLVREKFGTPPMIFSYPHSKYYKLEVKSRPHDIIKIPEFENLQGKNYVQKLSVDLSDNQVEDLFVRGEIDDVKKSLKDGGKFSKERVEAIFGLLELGLSKKSRFLQSRGSSEYERYALEVEVPDKINGSPVNIQVTFDYNMGTRKGIENVDSFQDPMSIIRKSNRISPFSTEEEFHIELKVPKVLIERMENGEASEELEKIISIFSKYRVTNKGKMNHIMLQRPIDE